MPDRTTVPARLEEVSTNREAATEELLRRAANQTQDLLSLVAGRKPEPVHMQRLAPRPLPSPANGARQERGLLAAPLYHHSGKVAFLDRDRDFLRQVRSTLPTRIPCEIFTDAHDVLDLLFIEQEMLQTERERQERIIHRWRAHSSSLPQQLLTHWHIRPQHTYTTVLVVAAELGGEEGFSVLRQLSMWPGRRILMTTGCEDAIAAFNGGLIERSLRRGDMLSSPSTPHAIVSTFDRPPIGFPEIWQQTLSAQQCALLRDPSVARELSLYCERNFREWVLLGEPFGILGHDPNGGMSFLQLHPRSDLESLAHQAQAEGFDATDIENIRAGRALVDIEMYLSLGEPHRATVEAAFSVGDAGTLLAAPRRFRWTP
jgi:hypothetical protein